MNRAKRQLINERTKMLENSQKKFRDIFNVIFIDKGRTFGQYTENGQIVQMNFGELYEMIEKYAYYILKKHGASHKYIGIDSENCISWVAAFWGIMLSGNKPYLVNCKHPETLKKSLLKTVEADLVIGLRRHDLDCEYLEYAEIEKSVMGEDREKVLKDLYENEFENEFGISTSATSLNETVCIYDGEAMASSILNAKYILENNKRMPEYYKGALRQLAFLPFYHIFGFSAVYMWFTFYGCIIVFLENYSGDTIMKTVRDHGVTHIFSVPLLWNTMEQRILKQVELQGEKTKAKFEKAMEFSEKIQKILPYTGEKIARRLFKEITSKTLGGSVRFCITGGVNVKESTLRFFNCLGYPMHNGYGMTETGITSVCLAKNIKERCKTAVGMPFPSVKYSIGDDGVMAIEGTSICRERIVNGVRVPMNGRFVTEDNFVKTEEGYFILGRKNDLIIGPDGENINPDMVEKSLFIPFGQRFCIFKEETGGREHPSLVIEIRKLCTPSQVKKTVEEAEAQCAKLSASYRPVNIYYTYDLISSVEAVKISRNFLLKGIKEGNIRLIKREEFDFASAEKEEFDGNTEIARLVRGIIADALNIKEEDILPDANVMTDLGGSSLDYFYIMSQIGEKTGVGLYTDETHCPYTLREFCREIEEQM